MRNATLVERAEPLGSNRGPTPARLLTAFVWGTLFACVTVVGTTSPVAGAEDAIGTVRLTQLNAPVTDFAESVWKRTVVDAVADAARRNSHLTLIVEFRGGRLEFGRALDLARFLSGEELQGARTVAYVPESIEGHLILPVLACGEIVMSDAAALGDAGKHEGQITDDVKGAYVGIAGRRKAVPEAVVAALLDRNLALYRIETADGIRFASTADGGGLPGIIRPEELKPPGEVAHFTGRQGSQWGFVARLAQDDGELAKAYGTTVETLRERDSAAGPIQAARIDLARPRLTGESVRRASWMLEEARKKKKNLIIFRIDSDGGAPTEAISLAGTLAALDPKDVRTVAYIPRKARWDALLIAWACHTIVAEPDAELGGEGDAHLDEDDRMLLAEAGRKIAERRFRAPNLLVACFDRQISVQRYERGRDVEYLTEAEHDALETPADWKRVRTVKGPDELFRMSGRQAHEDYRVLSAVVADAEELRAWLKLDNDPTLMEPTWAENLIDWLRSPPAAALLMSLAMFAFWFEMFNPTFSIGWLVFIVCMGLFFWSRFLGGTAGWLEVMLFVMGIAFLLLEFIVLPGVTVFGVAGGAMIVSSLILASQTFIVPHNTSEMWTLAGNVGAVSTSMLLAMAGIMAMWNYLPTSPWVRMLTAAPEQLPSTLVEPSAGVSLGEIGSALTHLVPSGKVRIGDKLLDVITSGEFVERGTSVRVIEAIGNRIVVEAERRDI